MKIGIVGRGTIATAVVQGIAKGGHEITVSTRSAANSTRLTERFENVAAVENQQVVGARNVLFIGLRDDVAQCTLEALDFREGQQVISLKAGQSHDAVAALVTPAKMAVRMIPFPSIATGGSPIMS